ncbi:hypothetical protein PAXINDRAFT_168870 [Paxillus involutus ATCC 200175]|uniref:Uncharacterized protein n=1 Tax=Paxillus involutus ATCC 200175 TaxID=664439 RepID=A0A0C9T0B3_PAXIN|nr:hypothetical protein PAXINDRAFT_168870 [Paxillus involutus ATCC 200175]
MPIRSFTVFQDTPTEIPQPRNDSHESALTLSLTETAAILLSTPAATEKENLHPVTGERAGPASGSEAKKRKTGALATKQLAVLSSKKQKEHKPESKKSRKPLSSGGKPKSSDGRKSSSKTSRSSRRASPLPPVDEEQELQRQPSCLSVSQANIDSRCYELTVSPLADVSEAYEATPAESPEPDAHSDREQSVEPAIRDYFSPSLVEKPLPATNKQQCNTDDSNCQHNDFSTPERKRIYSAFTFSSPSPTSERFKQSQAPLIHRDVPAPTSE